MVALSALLYRVADAAYTGNLDLDDVAGDQRTYARRRSCCYEVSGLQCHDLRDVSEEGRDREDHLAAFSSLALDAVHSRDDTQIAEVRKL
jgi:hypothetical protein